MKLPTSDIYIVRHGETDWNAQGILQGSSDIPLNQKGFSQARQLQETFADIPFPVVFSSDLARAQMTAQVVLAPREIPLITTPELRERRLGSFEGKKSFELDALMKNQFDLVDHLPKNQYLSHRWHPDVETSIEMFERLTQFIQKNMEPFWGLPILVVSHGGVIRSLLDHFDFIPRHKWIIHNCGFIHLKFSQKEMHLHDMHHITRIEM